MIKIEYSADDISYSIISQDAFNSRQLLEKHIDYINNIQNNITYNSNNRIMSITTSGGGRLNLEQKYTYSQDDPDRLTEYEYTLGSETKKYTYQYDQKDGAVYPDNRLIKLSLKNADSS